jgi:hypothetical protein
MTQNEQERMQQLLKQSMRPVAERVAAELGGDLWPAILKRLDSRPVNVPWFDWALLAAVAMWLLFSPRAIPLILYYL